jgi:hypothetical protein
LFFCEFQLSIGAKAATGNESVSNTRSRRASTNQNQGPPIVKTLFLALAMLAATGAAARADPDLAAFCWVSPQNPGQPVVCAGPDSAGGFFTFASIRALLDTGWSILDIAADPRFTADGVRLQLSRRPTVAANARFFLIFPPP